MDETIAALAARLAGLEETDTALLEPLCAAARQRWIDRLRQGVTEEACGESLTCAAAFSAAAEAVSGAGGAGGVTSFRRERCRYRAGRRQSPPPWPPPSVPLPRN